MVIVKLKKLAQKKTEPKIQQHIFSFSNELGPHLKTWLKQAYIGLCALWVMWIFSLFFYVHSYLLFHIYAYEKLQKSVNLPVNFNFLYKLNLFYLALEFTLTFLSVFFFLWCIAFVLTNKYIALFLYRYTWLIFFFLFLTLLFINWYCVITESALYSFRNNKVTTQYILKILLEALQFRYNNYLKIIFLNINILVACLLFLFGFFYLWYRLYFWHYNNFWKHSLL